jgi:uncharacterized protein (DUF2236 family)
MRLTSSSSKLEPKMVVDLVNRLASPPAPDPEAPPLGGSLLMVANGLVPPWFSPIQSASSSSSSSEEDSNWRSDAPEVIC